MGGRKCVECLNEAPGIRHDVDRVWVADGGTVAVCLYACGHEVYTADQSECEWCERSGK